MPSSSNSASSVELNPALEPVNWLLGTWESDEPGQGGFHSIKPFSYTEKLHFSHMGQPAMHFMFNASPEDSSKPSHRECGFIRMQPKTNRVAFIIAQDSGLVEIEEGELTGKQLTLKTHKLERISFAKEPHVQQICRVFQLRPDGKLAQTVSMTLDKKEPTQYLNITYVKTS
ncbi:peroxynitrite isomerase THAP4-like [Melanotaenia boesemani]|uniref:peroxynitrite isomerase THAP4-like n=1 Tax=Melanotaenia boesemani TaxID=1250792 RepID=UPI001C055259|nr:peroxynitrite isomerase THAP4-like [Melanotaenia boesemani]